MNPPPLARRILDAALPEADREDVVANLEDLFHFRCRRNGSRSAAMWYWWQALTFPIRLRLGSTRRGPGAHPDPSPGGTPLRTLLDDLRGSIRTLRRSPGYLTGVVVTLALGFGATTAIFAVVDSTALRPLPYPDPEEIVWVWPSGQVPLTLEEYDQLAPRAAPAAETSGIAFRNYSVLGGDAPRQVGGLAVTSNHFDVFGVDPVLGRRLLPEDSEPGAEAVALIGHGLWASQFGSDPEIVGRRVELFNSANTPMTRGAFSGAPYTVIGVLPEGYDPLATGTMVITALVSDPADPSYRNMGEIILVSRLRPEMTAERFHSELVRLSGQIPEFDDLTEAIRNDGVLDFRQAMYGSTDGRLWLTLGAVALVLLIACANVMNLSIVHSQKRRDELAVRHAMGANRTRIFRLLLTENAVLSAIAATIGFAVAALLLPMASALIPPSFVANRGIEIDGTVVVFAILCLVVTTALSGIGPALVVSRNLTATRLGGRGSVGSGKARRAVRSTLIVAELALALVLIQGAGLLLESFDNLVRTDPGFDPTNVMTFQVAPTEARYQDPEVRRAFFDDLLGRLRTRPEIQSAGAIHFLPIADGGPSVFHVTDPTDPETRGSSSYRVITPGYLETMGISLESGRDIRDDDRTGGAPVGLVNRSSAEQLWPDEDPLGKALYRTNGETLLTVVGVVEDVRQTSVGTPARAEIYIPLSQTAWSSTMTVVVRGHSEVPATLPIEEIVHAVDANVPIPRIATMESLIQGSIATARFFSILFAGFAGLALILGVVGVYGIISSVVEERTPEIGVRLALGASGRRVLRSELYRGLRVIACGIVVGLIVSAMTTRLLESLLVGVSPLDPQITVATSILLAAVAWAAVTLPALRASRIDPIRAIQTDA